MQIEGESPERHFRFDSGYTAPPVETLIPNTSPTFLGAGYDWSGVPWNAGSLHQSFVFLSRKHYLYANHFGAGTTLQYYSNVTGLGTASRASSVSVPQSDIGIARLTTLLPASAGIMTYPLLDLPTTNSYVGRDLLIYGWFAKVGKSKVSSVLPDGRVVLGSQQKYLFEYEGAQSRPDFVTLQGLDSGSPSFIPFGGELTLTGNHFYILDQGVAGGGDSFLALPEVIQQVNAVLGEEGFALRFRVEPATRWSGLWNASWGSRFNWTSVGVPSATQSLGFDGDSTTKSLSLDGDRTAKGLLFTGSEGQSGFTFQSGSVLRVGYAGIRNDAPSPQRFLCSMALNAPQHWTAALGELQVEGSIELNGHYLNLGGTQTIILGGPIQGSGGITILEGTTRLHAAANYTGPTYFYGGELHVSQTGQLPSNAPSVFAGGRLRVDLIHMSTGPIRLLDDSKWVFSPGSASMQFAASAGESWAADRTVTVEGFDSTAHQIKIGDSFDSISPSQRAAISFAGVPAFHGGDGLLRPATRFEQWQLAKFPDQAGNPVTEATVWGANANPSGDGANNFLKYALDLDPRSSSAQSLPQVEINPEGYLQISVVRNPVASEVSYLVEVSDDLTTWKSGAPHTVVVTADPDLLVVRDATLLSTTGRRFMRLVVQ